MNVRIKRINWYKLVLVSLSMLSLRQINLRPLIQGHQLSVHPSVTPNAYSLQYLICLYIVFDNIPIAQSAIGNHIIYTIYRIHLYTEFFA